MVVGICGGSGSGKSSIARHVAARLGPERAVVLCQDAYYRDLAHLAPEERSRADFDRPESIEWDLMAEHLHALGNGGSASVPGYDFVRHTRTKGECLGPAETVIVEGHLIFSVASIRAQLPLKIFLHADPDTLLLRRIRRDRLERGRDTEGILRQYEQTVRPNHMRFVETNMRWADLVVSFDRGERYLRALMEHAMENAAF
jgi:uridine kinase